MTRIRNLVSSMEALPRFSSALVLGALALLMSMSCTSVYEHQRDPHAEARFQILNRGQSISFTNPNGSVRVEWISPFERAYVIDGMTYHVKLFQRPREFNHQKGLLWPGARYTKAKEDRDVSVRFVVQESEVHFENADQMTAFLMAGASMLQWVSNSEGYVASYSYSPDRYQYNVDLFRFYLRGKIVRKIPAEYRYQGSVGVPE